MNRKLELLYRDTEWLSVISSVFQNDWSIYGQSDLYEGWKIIMRNQFHDIIPGSSIAEVYEDSRLEYDEAFRIGQKQWERSAEVIALGSGDKNFTVFNGAPWIHSELVCIPLHLGKEVGVWMDAAGNKLKAQLSSDAWYVWVPDIPSMGYTTLAFCETKANEVQERIPAAFHFLKDGIVTPFYEIAWNKRGQLIRIFDRQAGVEVLAENELGNVWQVFEDKPKSRHEAWDIDIYYQQKMRMIEDLKDVNVLEMGPLRVVIQFEWTYMDSIIKQNMVLYAKCRRIDFQTEVDWHEQRQLLKVAFPVRIRATEATYDVQFGNVKRPTHWNTSWDYAKFETVGHQWADLSERNYGISLLNDCKYGYDIKDHTIRLTLIKSAIAPDPQQDQGQHIFTYSLLSHQGDWYEGRTVQEAWALNNPVTSISGKSAVPEFSLFSLTASNIMVDAVKKAEDHDLIVLRVHEFAGIRGEVEIKSDLPISWWQECDLMETPEGSRLTTSIRLHLKPYEIKTLLIALYSIPMKSSESSGAKTM
jgi:alpha-mannosidase